MLLSVPDLCAIADELVNAYEVSAERYRDGSTVVLGEHLAPLPLDSPETSHEVSWD
jgi:hypothetical protein